MEMSEGVQVSVPGGQLFVQRWGEACPHRAPILLLHDSLGCVGLWRGFPQALAERSGREVIAWDRLGFGRSSARDAPATAGFIDEEASLHFPALRCALGLERFVLLGHSVGGAMALSIAAAEEARCEAVISMSAQAFVEERTRAGILAAQQQFRQPEHFARLQRWHGDRAHWVLDAWVRVWLSQEFSGWSLDAVLPQVRCQVLVIHGDQDEFGSLAFPQRIAGQVAGPADIMILPDCGHVPQRECEDQVLARIADFLGRHVSAAAQQDQV